MTSDGRSGKQSSEDYVKPKGMSQKAVKTAQGPNWMEEIEIDRMRNKTMSPDQKLKQILDWNPQGI